MLKKIILIAFTSLPFSSFSQTVDLQKYSGLWYEQVRLPARFQKDCLSSTAEYTLNEDKTVDVNNTCYMKDGKNRNARGIAKLDLKNPENRSLIVSFNIFTTIYNLFKGPNYYIYFLDDNYTQVIVGSPDKDYMWIMTRQAQIDKKDLNTLVKKAEAMGFKSADFIYDSR